MLYIYYLILIEITAVASLQISNKDKRIQPILYWINIFAIFLLAAFKDPDLTKDSLNYVNALNDQELIIEPSFHLIKNTVNNIFGGKYFWLFFIYSAIAIYPKSIGIKSISNIYLINLLIWYSDLYLVHELTQIRIAAAGGIFILAIPSLYNKDLKQYIFWTLCASVLHISAILMICLYFINYNRINIRVWIVFVIISIIIAMSGYDVVKIMTILPIDNINNKYDAYQNIQYLQDKVSLFSPLIFAKFLITVFLASKLTILNKYSKYSILYLKIMFLSTIARFLFAANISIAFRISEFMGLVEILLFPLLIYVFKQRKFGYIILVLIVLVFSTIRIFSNKLILY